MIGTFQPKQARTLEDAHQELMQAMIQQNQGKIRAEARPQSLQIDGHNALLTRMSGPSPYQGDKENDFLISVSVQNRLLYFVLIGPASRWSKLEPVYRALLQSVRVIER
jgi:hypothetical protein